MKAFCSYGCLEVEGYRRSQATAVTLEDDTFCVYCDEFLHSAFTWFAVA